MRYAFGRRELALALSITVTMACGLAIAAAKHKHEFRLTASVVPRGEDYAFGPMAGDHPLMFKDTKMGKALSQAAAEAQAAIAARAKEARLAAERASRDAQRRALNYVGGDCSPSPGEQFIIMRESGGSTTDYNSYETSTGHAFGIGQLTTENRIRFARILGVDPDTTNYCAQLAMMRLYIKERYGDTANAVEWWRGHKWY